MNNTRAIATTLLYPVLEEGQSFHASQYSLLYLSKPDRAFVLTLCFGVLRWHPQLTTYGTALLKKPFSKKDTDLWILLLIGIYQLHQLDTSAHAAIYETVAATEALKKPWARAVINAALRRFSEEKEALVSKFSKDQVCQTAHPLWLLRKLKASWPQAWENIAHGDQVHPPMHLRVHTKKISVEDYIRRLATHGITATVAPFTPDAVTLSVPMDIAQLPGFSDGLVSVQDIAAQWALDCMEIHGAETILDACAAPGGKTAHILERHPQTHVTAWEKDPARCHRLQNTLARIGVQATVALGDAILLAKNTSKNTFDRILLDAPCSGTGVIRRHPEIKYRLNDAVIADLCQQQSKLLDALWPLLKPNGRLIYTTCSVLPEENDAQLAKFIAKTSDSRDVRIQAPWGIEQLIGRQVLPGMHAADGFFYGILEKIHNPNL